MHIILFSLYPYVSNEKEFQSVQNNVRTLKWFALHLSILGIIGHFLHFYNKITYLSHQAGNIIP